VDSSSRIHASLNLNTETGRLSCRKPNLQNQPALDKDRYRVFLGQNGNWHPIDTRFELLFLARKEILLSWRIMDSLSFEY